MPVPNNTKFAALDAFLQGETIKAALYTDEVSFTFDPSQHNYVADVLDGGTTAWEFGANTGSGYSRQPLSNVSLSTDNTDDEGVFDADDTTFGSLDGATVQGVIVYRQVGTDDTTPGDDEIISIIDDANTADLPQSTNGGDVTFQWDTEGIVNFQ